MVQEELGNGQQCPGISGIPTDPAVQDFQEGDSTANVGGVLFADDVHDFHCLNETLQESRSEDWNREHHNYQSLSPTSVYLQLFAGLHHLSSGVLPEK